ncbi:MAG: 1-(5-phosphoribosyl)-5-[(5-phosphoribosylamino)methylideneamino]imidazole-4-carboxamide isomerase [Gammaproteobacteria bacterium]|nr:1-(5-phosphoribosyl)-5-[(5-phosphoribosylamino)methylideneamino]imidazole-4-carboxamide isomerase [Gammaproteobacteria bacterium]|tara:strand:- start:633 stop:1373 length:741 start_codon:yes stop_codon:yes gene_type:complete
MKIIPAIDLQGGNCVRLLRGDFNKVTKYSSNPVEIGHKFSSLAVADLHIVDLDGARTGHQENQKIVSKISKLSGLKVQLGGGIRTFENALEWLSHGVDRCVIGSTAISNPELVKTWINKLGIDKIVLALDVKLNKKDTPILTTHGWTEDSDISLWDCLDSYINTGLQHILCTDIDRDGAMTGPNFELYSEMLSRYPNIHIQASGGVRNIRDLQDLNDLGLSAAITGRALLDGRITEMEILKFQLDE